MDAFSHRVLSVMFVNYCFGLKYQVECRKCFTPDMTLDGVCRSMHQDKDYFMLTLYNRLLCTTEKNKNTEGTTSQQNVMIKLMNSVTVL